jgi:proteic killer suppression protein
MDILFNDAKLEQDYNSQRVLKKRFGKRMAAVIRSRLDNLGAANNLEEMRQLPGRCHELLGDRARQLSLDLVHPLRLIFIPADDPIPRKLDGGMDWPQITSVRILGIDDTHE